MKKTVLLLLLGFVTLNNFAQQEDSLLKNFKFRINHYRALNFSPSLGTEYLKLTDSIDSKKYTNLGGGLQVNYNTLKSTDNSYQTIGLGLNTSYNHTNISDIYDDNKVRFFNVRPSLELNNKWFNKQHFFFQLDAYGSLGLTGDKQLSNVGITDYKNNAHNYSAALVLGAGKGRLENITNMQNALWLYKDLKKEGLANNFSDDDLTGLGEAITEANNTRVLDSRRRIQYILKRVDGYLQNKKLISKTDINYFSVLNDILFYTFNIQRLSGKQFYINVTPGINSDASSTYYPGNDSKNKNSIDKKFATLSLGVANYKPTSLTHQNNYGAGLVFEYLQNVNKNEQFTGGNTTGFFKYTNDYKAAFVRLFYEHSIYPNTRTIISFNINSENGYNKTNTRSGLFTATAATESISYFISYQTRFFLNVQAVYNRNAKDNLAFGRTVPEKINLYLNSGFNISL